MFKMYNDYKFNLEKDCYENIKNNNYFTVLEVSEKIHQVMFYNAQGEKLLEKEIEIDNFDEELKKIINEIED